MAMVRVPVDEVWVSQIAELAQGPWTVEAVTSAFVRFGWTGALVSSELPWLDCADPLPGGLGWCMHFHEWPPSEGDPDGEVPPSSGVELFCAGFWPPHGAEDEGDQAAGDREELLRAADEWSVCRSAPTARRAEFVAEFERIHALVRKALGEPSRTLQIGDGAVRVIWEYRVMALILVMEPCAASYGAHDWIALRVAPVRGNGDLAD
jgi:hypothetical protein